MRGFLCLLPLQDRNSGQWDAHLYPVVAKDGTGAGPRNNHVVPACHMCCFA